MIDDPTNPSQFVKCLVACLHPYFKEYTAPEAERTFEILLTLTSYGATTRAEMLHAALTVAFGFSALDALAEAKRDTSLAPSLRQRIRAGASTLNRACHQNAALVTARRTCDQPAPRNAPASVARRTPAAPAAATPSPVTQPGPVTQPESDVSEETVAGAFKQVRATLDACRSRPARPSAQPAAGPRPRNSALAHLFAEAAAPA
ncbi:MAG TPA: hypothetical protein VE650_14410 [Acetobacteraceae bacterium]|nr:hypothetical protein [Acetobacteraceae bacterium]